MFSHSFRAWKAQEQEQGTDRLDCLGRDLSILKITVITLCHTGEKEHSTHMAEEGKMEPTPRGHFIKASHHELP